MFLSIIFLSLFVVKITCTVKNNNDERDINGKVVAITGGAQGIDFAIAENFLQNGAKVVITLDINIKKGEEAARNLNSNYGKNRAEFIECDVTRDLERISRTIVKKYKYIDVLINVAGVFKKVRIEETLLVNTVAPMKWSYKFLEHMRIDKHGRGGTIINMATTLVHGMDPTFVIYKTSKLAILGFSRSLGHEYNYKKNGVRILTLCPGLTNTTMGFSVSTIYNEEEQKELRKFLDFSVSQTADDVGKATVDVFRNAETGTSWDIEGGKPPIESSYIVTVSKEREIVS